MQNTERTEGYSRKSANRCIADRGRTEKAVPETAGNAEENLRTTISLENVTATVDTHGAEMVSLKKDGTELLWTADPAYWNRHAPVLFPFVGKVRDGRYRFGGAEYPMGQHGFARDREFRLESKEPSRLIYALDSDAETRSVYPFDWTLKIIYELKKCDPGKTGAAEGSAAVGSNMPVAEKEGGICASVTWLVENRTDGELYFSIGGHPGFLCPVSGKGDWPDYRLVFRKNGKALASFTSRAITKEGYAGEEFTTVPLAEGGLLTPTRETFAHDALVLEDGQCDEIALARKVPAEADAKPYITLRFDAPLVGVWSPVKRPEHAPFICIEPWYGRADRAVFTGSLEEREWANTLPAGGTFRGGYTIIV